MVRNEYTQIAYARIDTEKLTGNLLVTTLDSVLRNSVKSAIFIFCIHGSTIVFITLSQEMYVDALFVRVNEVEQSAAAGELVIGVQQQVADSAGNMINFYSLRTE